MDDVITLRFQYTEKDYVQALRTHFYRQMGKPVDLAVLVVTFAAGVNLWASPGMHIFGVACVSVVALYGLIMGVVYFIAPQRAFRRDPKLHDEYNLEFSSSGIRWRTVNIDSQLQWSLYTRALSGPYSYILYYDARSITIIPKRVFASPQQQEDFERLLSSKISKITRWRS